jgi:hypothetical protein
MDKDELLTTIHELRFRINELEKKIQEVDKRKSAELYELEKKLNKRIAYYGGG